MARSGGNRNSSVNSNANYSGNNNKNNNGTGRDREGFHEQVRGDQTTRGTSERDGRAGDADQEHSQANAKSAARMPTQSTSHAGAWLD